VLTLDELTTALTRFAVVEDTEASELRAWSPSWYAMKATRGSANVIHVSCLVLDYDASYPLTHAAHDWHECFHIVHSTWAHTEELPRFRIIVPLAHPVRGGDWVRVWKWAVKQCHGHVDGGAEKCAHTFLLPAVPTAESPRFAFCHPGPLLNPRALGLVTHAARIPTTGHQPHPEGFFHRAAELASFVESDEITLPPEPASTDTAQPPESSAEAEPPEPTAEPEPAADQAEEDPPPASDKKPPKRATKPTIEVVGEPQAAIAGLQRGLEAAAPALESVITRMQEGLRGDCDVSEIEVELAFSAAGDFLGFGSGGDITLRVRVRPQERAAAPRRQKRSTGN